MIKKAVDRYFSGLWRLKTDVWFLEGEEKHSGEKLVITYAGIEVHKNYFKRLAFRGSIQEKVLGRFWVWRLPARILKRPLGQSLRVTELNPVRKKFFRGRARIKVPLWVSLEQDLSGAHLFEKDPRFNNHRQKIRQYDLTYRIQRDEASLRDFYSNMYVPYIKLRHSDSAYVASYEEIKGWFLSGQLSGLEKDGVMIVSHVVSRQGNIASGHCLALRRGYEGYLKKDIIKVLHYLTWIQLAKEGCRAIGMGYSRGFLKDGVLKNKLLMGSRLTGGIHEGLGHLIYEIDEITAGLKSFLALNPVILMDDDKKLYAGFFSEGGSDESLSDLRFLADEPGKYGLAGLKRIRYQSAEDRGDIRIYDAPA